MSGSPHPNALFLSNKNEIFDKLANESSERARRTCTVVLYNIPEASGNYPSSWDQQDIEAAIKALKPIRL